eukprot:3322886-Rhodomonas_salina.1
MTTETTTGREEKQHRRSAARSSRGNSPWRIPDRFSGGLWAYLPTPPWHSPVLYFLSVLGLFAAKRLQTPPYQRATYPLFPEQKGKEQLLAAMESINGVLGDAPSPAQMHDVEREDVLLICGASVVLEDSEES